MSSEGRMRSRCGRVGWRRMELEMKRLRWLDEDSECDEGQFSVFSRSKRDPKKVAQRIYILL